MFVDFILASLHHLAVFPFFAIVACELVLLRPSLDVSTIKRLAVLDLLLGVFASLIVLAGFARVFFGAKGPDFYFSNHVFWTKIGLFVIIGLLSIWPTLNFIAWRREIKTDPKWLPDAQKIRKIKRLVHIEAGLLILLPILGAAMARGYGLR
jgi:putative membrane protein